MSSQVPRRNSSMSSNNINEAAGTGSNNPPFPSVITSRDLDVEDAEGSNLEAVEQNYQQQQQQTPQQPMIPFWVGTQQAQTQSLPGLHNLHMSNNNTSATAMPLDGSQRSAHSDPVGQPLTSLQQRRLHMLRRNSIRALHTHTAAHNFLQDIQEEDETEAILNNSAAAASSYYGGEKDGLMKDHLHSHKHNPYAADYDQVLLKADTTSDENSSEEDHNERIQLLRPFQTTRVISDISSPQPPGHHRSQSVPIFPPNASQQPPHNQQHNQQSNSSVPEPTPASAPGALPPPQHQHPRRVSLVDFHNTTRPRGASMDLHTKMHHSRQPSASDYIATDQDGYMDVVMGANGSFATSTSNNNGASAIPPGIKLHHPQQQRPKPHKTHCCPRIVREIGAMFHPLRVARNCRDILVLSFFGWVGIPCLLASAILFCGFGNPQMAWLPGEATLSWWLLFATRQTVTLGLARLTVYIVVDGFMLGTRLAVQTLGPLLTLIAATGKGWPLILATWGTYNLTILNGDHPFQVNWLGWTGWEFFNQSFEGDMLHSSLYTRILLSAVLGGLSVSAKRTFLALRFGRKQFAEFKPRLERILADVVLLSEIAALAEHADKVEEPEQDEDGSENIGSWDIMTSVRHKSHKHSLKDFLWTPSVGQQDESELDRPSHEESADERSVQTTMTDRRTSMAENLLGDYDKRSFMTASEPITSPRLSQMLRKTGSGRLSIKDMLDPWDEPEVKGEKSASEISIHDILKFRRALSHLDEDMLFGEAFGPTASRDQCISSSNAVYYRLLKLASLQEEDIDQKSINPTVLSFDVLALIALNEDGVTENLAKKRMIRRIFTPDRSGALPCLAFVQACDKIYKRIRYFRASIRNASVIDGVLERLVNGLFYFVLIMMLSSLMELNPWTLLLSITSLLVSVSFALGASVSKYVEGVLLIAVRRPYDLGDRIFMSSAEGINPMPDVTRNSWFVEDITLTTTTLRYARTNEVSTINNWSIAGSRIVNCARSTNATVHFEFKGHLSILEGDKLDQFRGAIRKYVEEHPRVWDSVAHIRHDMFDADQQRVDFAMALRHRSSWQEAGRIKIDRSDVFRFLYELGKKLDVHFAGPVPQQVVYDGGQLKRGDADDCYMRDLIKGSNINIKID